MAVTQCSWPVSITTATSQLDKAPLKSEELIISTQTTNTEKSVKVIYWRVFNVWPSLCIFFWNAKSYFENKNGSILVASIDDMDCVWVCVCLSDKEAEGKVTTVEQMEKVVMTISPQE